MSKVRFVVGLFVVFLCVAWAGGVWAVSAIPESQDVVADIVERVSPAVVNIDTLRITVFRSPLAPFFNDPFFRRFFGDIPELERQVPQRGIGTGFVFRSDGYILTNEHVIRGANEIKVTFIDGKEYKGKVVGADPMTDIAVVKIDATNLPTIPLGDSDKARVGEFVIAIGNPYGLSHTVTVGVLSAKGRPISAGDSGREYENFLQTDAAINPGNSGGPLLNLRGEVIGINTAILPYAQGIGFAVPINMVKSILDQLLAEGRVIRAWLGVYIQDLTPEMAEKFGLPEAKGALVADVSKGSPAEKAGLRRGDIVLKVDEKETPTVSDLQREIRSRRPGDRVRLEIWRDGKRMILEATLGELKDSGTVVPEAQKVDLGFEVAEITPELVEQYSLKTDRGVVIVSVQAGGPADEAGLRPGDVILEVNRKEIASLADWESALAQVRPGDTVLLLIDRGGRTYFVPLKAEER
ncbi:DegQ family serine endoprotease [Candidatus Caldatribacterium sp.]|uniref:DegQ family serine endoprotease n=1 Tax=Candidatus Caldatribacterium sp. TaxID=2282143 RepID=UPI00299CC759|nr:DegQ family serine endoprotease [Candidatus Caldatribacterium sp.]MDW8080854.1 DegQ family serine endoprotease [Candidatus Calescibacterium sp.]